MNENNEVEHQLERALGELAEAKHDMDVAAALEHRAEARREGAEHLLEKIGEELAKESKIKVNGRTRTVEGHEVTFEEVVKLAFPSGPTKANTRFTVTFRHAAEVPAAGEMDPGQVVKAKPGHHPDHETIFNVTETVLS